jgi:UDP:flavonoid glycosyltransferase YjiC (YdhE family)
VREFLPQVRLLDRAAVAVTHGGNNSVTEAMTAGVPLVVLPFSTDQFAGAAALERVGYGLVLAPNSATVDELVAAIVESLDPQPEVRERLTALSTSLRAVPGAQRAFAAIRDRASANA